MSASQLKAYGLWHVTTEGDCEGRSLRDLGIHEGFFDEIAFSLASSAMHELRFSPVDPAAYKRRQPQTRAQVSLDIETGTWDLKGEARVEFFEKFLEGRPVSVTEHCSYAGVEIVCGRNPQEQKQMRKEAARQAALSKLSPADIEALGLKGPMHGPPR